MNEENVPLEGQEVKANAMKFAVMAPHFASCLELVCRAVPNKTTLVVLRYLRMDLDGKRLTLTATDLDLTISKTIEVVGQANGSALVPAQMLKCIIAAMPYDAVEFEVVGGEAVMTCGAARQTIAVLDAEEYPKLPEMGDPWRHTVTTANIAVLVKKTGFAVSTDFSRMALTGIYCEFKKDRLEMVATDGHRLGKAGVGMPGLQPRNGVILQPKALQVIVDIAKRFNQDVEFQISGDSHYAMFRLGTLSVWSKTIGDNKYPDIANVIPKEFWRFATMPGAEIMGLLDRAKPSARRRDAFTILEFSEGLLSATAQEGDYSAKYQETLKIKYQGDPIRIGVNAHLLSKCISILDSRHIQLKMNSPLGAILIEPVDAEADHFTLCMPLRIISEAGL